MPSAASAGRTLALLLMCLMLALPEATPAAAAPSRQAAPGPSPTAAPSPAPAASSQLVTVYSDSVGSSYATLSAWQRNPDGTWTRRFGPVAARVGGAGIGHASEGSALTPGGTFPLTETFGILPDPGTRMPYFRTDPADWWDENPSSPTYNLHVRRASSPGGASENLYYSGAAYNYGANIGYNLRRTPGAGSAFFLHVNTGTSTAGCVSIDQGTLAAILRWLDPAQHPYIDIRVGAPLVPAMTSTQAATAVYVLYRGLLRRDPNPGALAIYRRRLLSNTTRTQRIAAAVATTPERSSKLVIAAYAGCVRRPQTARERSIRTVRLGRGGTLADLYVQVCGSAEAVHAAGSDRHWVEVAARFLLGRSAGTDAGTWTRTIRRAGPATVVRAIVGSAEFGRVRADGIYHALLGRRASAGEAAHFGRTMAGRGVFTLPPTLAAGAEFFRHLG